MSRYDYMISKSMREMDEWSLVMKDTQKRIQGARNLINDLGATEGEKAAARAYLKRVGARLKEAKPMPKQPYTPPVHVPPHAPAAAPKVAKPGLLRRYGKVGAPVALAGLAGGAYEYNRRRAA